MKVYIVVHYSDNHGLVDAAFDCIEKAVDHVQKLEDTSRIFGQKGYCTIIPMVVI